MSHRYDVLIVGAGIAGSACALFLAGGGRHVAVVDRRRLPLAGAHWVNGVPLEAFEEVSLSAPVAPELRGDADKGLILASPSGTARVHLHCPTVREIDMRLLGQRLRDEARSAGATFLEGTSVKQVRLEGSRPVGLLTSRGELSAPLLIDASGLSAPIRRAVFPHWPEVPREHLCLAAQAVYRIDDLQEAAGFLERYGLEDDQTLALTGTAGGYSILHVRVSLEAREVSILTGSIHDRPGIPSGAAMLEAFRRDHSWIGDRLFGGSGAIPVRRPYARLVAPGLALLGDSACQVFPAHGSGIGIGLRAARQLADAVLAAPPEEAGDEEVLWQYACAFHRGYGGLLTAYDLVRRLTQNFTPEESEAMLEKGLADPEILHAGLNQRLPAPSLRNVWHSLTRAVQAPRLASRVAKVLSLMPLCNLLTRRYPSSPDLSLLRRLEGLMAGLFQETPDPVT